MVFKALEDLIAQHSSHSKGVLLLECIKTIADAFQLMELIDSLGTAMQLQVLYVSSQRVGQTLIHWSVSAEMSGTRDSERMVLLRQDKWVANASRLLEFFSSMGVLAEVCTSKRGDQDIMTLSKSGYGRPEHTDETLRLL